MKRCYMIVILLLVLAGCAPLSLYKGSSNSFGQNDLMRAIYFQDAQKVKELIQGGIDLNEVDVHGATILHYTANYGTEEIAAFLAEQPLEQLHLQEGGIRNNLPLQEAVISSNMEVFKIFAEAFPSPLDEVRDEMGRGLLHYAAIQMDESLISELLETGADPNLEDVNGNTPAHLFLFSVDTRPYSDDQGAPHRIAEKFFSNGMMPDTLNRQGVTFRNIVDGADSTANIRPIPGKHSLLDTMSLTFKIFLNTYDEKGFKNIGD